MATMKTLNGYGFNATEFNGKTSDSYTAADSSKLGGKAPEYYIQPRNLLDNSVFEIAQAGYGGKHGNTVYAADRWAQNDTTERTYTYTTKNGHGALKCSADTRIQQRLYLVDGQNYTAAFYINDKLYILTFVADGGSHGTGAIWVNYQSDGSYMFVISDIPAGGIVAEPVLYCGIYTADTLPPYVPKGYAAELAECQRYYIEIGTQPVNGWCYDWGQVNVFVPTPTLMRQKKPSVILNTASPNFYIGSTSYNATLIGGESISNGIFVKYSHAATVRGQCIIPEFSAKISAEL